MVEELARWMIPVHEGGGELLGSLDFASLERVQEQSVAGGRRRSNDIVWRVRFRDRAGDDERAWMHLVLMLEFQSKVDFLMAVRCRHYVDSFHLETWRGERFKASDRLPPVLVFVIYTGGTRLSAARRVADLVDPETADHVPEGRLTRSSPLFAGEGYVTVDSGRVGEDDLKRDNAAALLAALEHPSVTTAHARAKRLYLYLATEARRELRGLLLGWAQRLADRRLEMDLGLGDMAEVDRANESDELDAYFEERRLTFVNRYLEEGRAEGRAEERALLHRQAARRFGAEPAASLAMLLEDVDDPERLAEVGDWIVDCTTGGELVERIEAASASARPNASRA